MKTVIINGSPRKNGDTAALLNHYKKEMGGTIVSFDTHAGRIASCLACGGCDKQAGCVIQDDLQSLLKAVDTADVVILASPVHFTELSGTLLSALSRLQCLWAANNKHRQPLITDKRRQGIILLTAGSNGPFDKAMHTATVLLHQMGIDAIQTIISRQTDILPAAHDTMALGNLSKIIEGIKKDAVD